jgi:predicted metalloendopeptidase
MCFNWYDLMFFRVNGALSNMPEFSQTFNCPVNSKMNSKVKCDVW